MVLSHSHSRRAINKSYWQTIKLVDQNCCHGGGYGKKLMPHNRLTMLPWTSRVQGCIYTQCNAYANVYRQGQRQRTRFKMSNQLCRFFICDLHTSQIHAVHPFDKCSPPYWRLSFFCAHVTVHVDLQKETFWTLWRRSLFDIRKVFPKKMKISNGFAMKGGEGLVSVWYISNIQLQKKRGGIKRWMEFSDIKRGGGGVGMTLLMANAIKDFHTLP